MRKTECRARAFVMGSLLWAGLLSGVACGSVQACEKKGIALAAEPYLRPADLLRTMNAHWYYDWTPRPMKDSGDVAFVPMLSGAKTRLASDLQSLAARREPVLLGFNEPDLRGDAQMTADEAAALWPQLVNDADRLGSPAASARHPEWLEQFMTQIDRRKLKVDFVAIHYYGPPDARAFLRIVDDAHAKYHRPVWITEFAVLNAQWQTAPDLYSPQDVLRFMQTVVPELKRRPYVERFAWWGFGKAAPEALRASRFFEDDGSLTKLGHYYAKFESQATGKLCGESR